jgi:hypothetical protein
MHELELGGATAATTDAAAVVKTVQAALRDNPQSRRPADGAAWESEFLRAIATIRNPQHVESV